MHISPQNLAGACMDFHPNLPKIQLSDQGYEIQANLIPSASIGCDEVAGSGYFRSGAEKL
jgi:hypothetical protein